MLRGCGSSVNSTDTAHPWSMQYWICALISSSVRSGRVEKVPCLIRICAPSSARRRRRDVGRVGGLVVEADLAPGVEGLLQGGVLAGSLLQDVLALLHVVATLVAGLDHGLHGDAVALGTRLDPHGVTDRATTELEDDVLTEVVEQLVHLAGVDTAGSDRHDARHGLPRLVEVDAVLRVHPDEVVPQGVVVPGDHVGVALELAHHGAGVD